jgi:hypothetical protein
LGELNIGTKLKEESMRVWTEFSLLEDEFGGRVIGLLLQIQRERGGGDFPESHI